jgi:hypothetical protein
MCIPNPGPGPLLLVSLLVYLAIGVNEEFTFRGYQLRNLAEGRPAGASVRAWLYCWPCLFRRRFSAWRI